MVPHSLPTDYAVNPGQGALYLGYIMAAVGKQLGGYRCLDLSAPSMGKRAPALWPFAKKTHVCFHRFIHRCFKI